MANKVLTFTSTTQHISSEYAELYRDVSMHADIHKTTQIKKPNINDYLALLRTEDTTLSNVVVAEYETESDIISAIAIVKKTGYEDEYAKYLAYMNNSKFKVAKLIDYKAIANSLHQIFTWIKGERVLDPEFGSNLYRLLYEGITDLTSERIIAEIRMCVSKYEPRVQIDRLENVSNIDDTENNTIRIDIVYSVPSLEIHNARYRLEYDYSEH